QPAVRIDSQLLGRERFERLADARRDEFRGFDQLGLDIYHAESERAVPSQLLDDGKVLVAFATELQDELVYVGVEHRGEQEVIMALPRRPRVAIAVADVQPPGDVDITSHDV